MKKLLSGILAVLSVALVFNLATAIPAQAQSLTLVSATFTRDISLTSPLTKGNDVSALQSFLVNKGFKIKKITGNFGTETVAALIAYQTSKGISPANGRFGRATRAAVISDLAASNKTVGSSGSVSTTLPHQLYLTGTSNPIVANNYIISKYDSLPFPLVNFSLKSQVGDSGLSSLNLSVSASGTAPTTLYLYSDTGGLLSSKAVLSSGVSSVTFDNLNVVIKKDTAQIFTVKGDFPANGKSGSVEIGKVNFVTYKLVNQGGTNTTGTIMTTSESPVYGTAQSFYDSGSPVFFKVTYPTANETLKIGGSYKLTWTGGDPGVDNYSVFLVGGALGNTTALPLGTAYASDRYFNWTVPGTVTPASGYQIQFSGKYVSGDNSPSFSIANGSTSAPAQFNLAYQPKAVLGQFSPTSGKPTAIIATFTMNVSALTGNMTLPTGSDFEVKAASNSTNSINAQSINVVTIPYADIAQGSTATVTVTALIPITAAQYGSYVASIKSIKYKVGGIAGTKTDGLENYVTSPVTVGTTQVSSLTVTNPTGAETYKADDIVGVKWTSQNIPSDKVVTIALLSKNNDSLYVETPTGGYCNQVGGCVSVSTGQFSFRISNAIAPGEYRLKVICWDKNSEGTNCGATGQTNYFKVIRSNQGYSFNRDITVGTQGGDVLKLKTFLKSKGFYGIWDPAVDTSMDDSSFWKGDAKALAQYQQSVGITPADGYFGPTTRAAVNADMGSTNTNSPITITSPNGGETLQVGKTYGVTWNSSPLPANSGFHLQLSYVIGGSVMEDVIGSNITGNSYQWKVPEKYFAPQISPSSFKMRVVADGPNVQSTNPPQDYSDGYFSVNWPVNTPTASLTVNKRDTPTDLKHDIAIKSGTTLDFKWSGKNATKYTSIYQVTQSNAANTCGPTGPAVWIANSSSGSTSFTYTSQYEGCTWVVVYSADGIVSDKITVTVVKSTPTASITVNKRDTPTDLKHDIAINSGTTLDFKWTGTGATKYTSTYQVTQSNAANTCGPTAPTVWSANSSSGSTSFTYTSLYEGCTWVVVYYADGVVSDKITVTVVKSTPNSAAVINAVEWLMNWIRNGGSF